jgi:hypothetical protein
MTTACNRQNRVAKRVRAAYASGGMRAGSGLWLPWRP